MDNTKDIIADLEARHAKGGKPDSWESAQSYLSAQHRYDLDTARPLHEPCTWANVAKAVRDQEAPTKAAAPAVPKTPPAAAEEPTKEPATPGDTEPPAGSN